MNKKSLDPAGHLTLAVSNLEKSKKFYKSLFGKLKFKQIRDGERSVAWATREGFGIWIRQAKHAKPRYKYFAPSLQHLCVKAKTRKTVDEIYKLMSAKKKRKRGQSPFLGLPLDRIVDSSPNFLTILSTQISLPKGLSL